MFFRKKMVDNSEIQLKQERGDHYLSSNNTNGNQAPTTNSSHSTKPLPLNLNQIKTSFNEKLNHLISEHKITIQSSNIWILSELLIPLSTANNSSIDKLGGLKLKYLQPENYASIQQNSHNDDSILPVINGCIDDNLDLSNSNQLSVPFNFKINTELNNIRNHIHTYYAYNQQCMLSAPLVTFPQNDLDPILTTNLIRNTVSIENSSNGDLNNINMFLNWIRLFVKQQQSVRSSSFSFMPPPNSSSFSSSPTLLLINSYMYVKLSNLVLSSQEYNELSNLLQNENIYLLVYPVEKSNDQFNINIFKRFREIWKAMLASYSLKENPNNELSFLYMYKQCLRKLILNNKNLVRDSFNQLIKMYSLPLEPFADLADQSQLQHSQLQPQNSIDHDSNMDNSNIDELLFNEDSERKNDFKISDLSEKEIDEYIDWIDEMSKMGCLSIKHTFLRDLYLKCKFIFSANVF